MSQVSWRRILERAGDAEPGESGAAIIDLQERAQGRLQRRPQKQDTQPPPPSLEDYDVPLADLEAELSRALGHTQSQARAPAPARTPPPPRRRAPVLPPESEPPRQRQSQHMRSAPALRPDRMAPVAPPFQQPARKSKGKNLLAISISAAVISFAIYQIGNQWSETNGSGAQPPDSATDQTGPSMSITIPTRAEGTRLPTEAEGNERTELQGNRIDLRPSLTSGRETAATSKPTRVSPLDKDIQEAARLLAKAEQGEGTTQTAAAQPAGQKIASLEAGTEQAMLERGYEMMDQGRVESARLVFEHLAEQNSALAAFALAQSYDPSFLSEKGMDSSLANPELAASWYERAVKLTGTLNSG